MADLMEKIKQSSDDIRFILKDALESEDKGIRMTEEVVRGDLDEKSIKLMKNILDKDREHVSMLNKLMQ
ncbi:MAG: ferritin-like domain-containing protein [Clostridiaceae bacterium]|nr:ferritin-like domain-containing protein [Clostridiaceae bacterium]